MSDAVAKGPPPIGEALGAGWNGVKAHLVPTAIAGLVAYVLNIIPGMGSAGSLKVGSKVIRGQAPEVGDALIGFSKFVDYFVIGLLAALGVVACFIGIFVTIPLFMPGMYFIMEQNMTWTQAKDKCMALVKPNLVQWLIFHVVVMLAGGLGAIACFVGVFVTMPMAFGALFYAYEHAFKDAAVAEPAAVPAA